MSNRSLRALAIVLTVAGLSLGLLISGAQWKPLPAGLPDAGQTASWLKQFTYLLTTVLGVLVLGKVLRIAFFIPGAKAELSSGARLELRKLNQLAGLWSVSNIFAGLFTLQFVLGLSFSSAFSSRVIGTYIFSLAPARSYILAAIFGLIIALLCSIITSLNSIALLFAMAIAGIVTPLLNSHSASLGDHSLAITSSIVHGVAMALWVGGLWAILPEIQAANVFAINRFSKLAEISISALIISGVAAAYARLDAISDLWTSGYGRLVLIKTALLFTVALIARRIRAAYRSGISVTRLVSMELSIMAAAIGFGVALHAAPLSRAAIELPSAAEEILGFVFPPAPTFSALIFGWHPEWTLLTLSVGALALYVAGVKRLHKHEIAWPALRTISFASGVALLAWSTSAGISRYAMVSFAYHMIQHMMLSMLAPIFLVLGAPITLALRALPTTTDNDYRNARQWLTSILHSKYAVFIGHPLIVLAIFTFGLYGMYFTPLFSSLMASHTGHLFMEFHFLLSGALFAFIVVGVDPAPREVPHYARLLLVLVAISLHAFFAIAIMQSGSPLGDVWYSQVRPPWIPVPLDDTYAAGGIAWAIGEIPSLILMVIVAVQWARSDSRMAARLDRQAERDGDLELNSYNEYLASLNKETK